VNSGGLDVVEILNRFHLILKSRSSLLIYLSISSLFVISTLSRLLYHGFVGRFDHFLYQPDGALYTQLALQYSGLSPDAAGDQVIGWYSLHGKPGLNFQEDFFKTELNPGVWALVSVRILYPLLSTPFVQVLGIQGMLVIPIISYGILLLTITLIARRLNNLPIGLALVFLLTTSSTVSRWYIANITDGLLATLFALSLLVLVSEKRHKTLLILILITLTSFTRFCLPIWLAIGIFLVLKNRLLLGTATLAWSLINFIPVLIAKPDLSFVAPKESQNLIERGLEFVGSSFELLFVEIGQLIATDRALFVVILAAIVLSFSNLKSESSQLFILVGLAVWFIGALNPVLGVNFRYQLPLLCFACWTILDKLYVLRDRPLRDVLHIK